MICKSILVHYYLLSCRHPTVDRHFHILPVMSNVPLKMCFCIFLPQPSIEIVVQLYV